MNIFTNSKCGRSLIGSHQLSKRVHSQISLHTKMDYGFIKFMIWRNLPDFNAKYHILSAE